jgi:hypothetical protein
MSFATETTVAIATLTAEQNERIAKLREQIAKIEARIQQIIEGKPAKAAKKERPLPNVGDVVTFLFGRTTPTTSPKEVTGTVIAVKPSEQVDGKTRPALVRVQFGEGFDAQVATILPAAIRESSAEVAQQIAE